LGIHLIMDEQYSSGIAGSIDETENPELHIGASVISNALLFFLVFGMSATVDINSLKNQIRNYRALGTGLFSQFVVLPFLGFIFVKIFRIDAVQGITLLIITSSPGGSYSNWWCSIFNAELALSIAMTAISTVFSVGFLPMNLYLYATAAFGKSEVVESISFITLGISVGLVILAVVLGVLVSSKLGSPRTQKVAYIGGNVSGILLILFSTLIAIFGDGEKDYEELENGEEHFYFSTALPCFFGLIFTNFLSWLIGLKHPERVTCAVECCYQNTGIATATAMSLFTGSDLEKAVLVPLWYGLFEAVLLGFYLAFGWKLGWTKAPKNEKFCVVIATSYELTDEAENKNDGTNANDKFSIIKDDEIKNEQENVHYKFPKDIESNKEEEEEVTATVYEVTKEVEDKNDYRIANDKFSIIKDDEIKNEQETVHYQIPKDIESNNEEEEVTTTVYEVTKEVEDKNDATITNNKFSIIKDDEIKNEEETVHYQVPKDIESKNEEEVITNVYEVTKEVEDKNDAIIANDKFSIIKDDEINEEKTVYDEILKGIESNNEEKNNATSYELTKKDEDKSDGTSGIHKSNIIKEDEIKNEEKTVSDEILRDIESNNEEVIAISCEATKEVEDKNDGTDGIDEFDITKGDEIENEVETIDRIPKDYERNNEEESFHDTSTNPKEVKDDEIFYDAL